MSILKSLFPKETKITTPHDKTLFDQIGILSITVQSATEMTRHPTEDGTIVTENKINKQTQFKGRFIIVNSKFDQLYKRLNKLRIKSQDVTIQTRVDIYENVYIATIDYTEDNRFNDCVMLEMSLIQQQFVKMGKKKIGLKSGKGSDGDSKLHNPKVA